MATKFKYSLESLEWDEQHLRNKEGVYCYCGLDYSEGDSMLKCESCSQLFHWDCVSCLKTKPLRGDSFYRFKCSVCNGGTEEYERDTLSWVQVIYLVLYHLVKTEPDKKYFRWRENICATISDNWEGLMPGKAKTATWHNTVAGCLSTHHSMFRSGFDDTQQTGNWTLQDTVPPAQARFKAAVKSREPRTAKPKSKAKAEAKRPRKKVEVTAGSEAEKEILEVLNERSGDAKKAARPRVSFSDDESEGEHRSTKRKAKRRRAEAKTLENDVDLLQSFEIFTRLEKERLGEKASGASGLDDVDDLESLSSLSSLSSDSELDFADAPSKVDLDGEATNTQEQTGDTLPRTAAASQSTGLAESPAMHTEPEPVESPKHREARASSSGGQVPIEDERGFEAAPNDQVADGHAAQKSSDLSGGPSSSAVLPNQDLEQPAATTPTKNGVPEPGPLPEPVWTRIDGVGPRPLFDESSQPIGAKLPLMSEQSQWEVCAKIGSSHVPLTSTARRLRRRLELRRFKRMLGLPVLDVDQRVKECLGRQQMPWPERPIDRQAFELAGGRYGRDDTEDETAALRSTSAGQRAGGSGRSDGYAGAALGARSSGADKAGIADGRAAMQREIKQTAYANSFASRLQGRAFMRDSLTTPVAKVSPFHGRLLRPYIWRDVDVLARNDGKQEHVHGHGLAMLRVQRAIRSREHPVFRKLGIAPAAVADSESIDYVYFQREHVAQVNALLCRTFWPGIDVSEALMYPEFSIVALHKRTVVGCAFLTPEAYLTYIAVSAGWEGAGVAKFMIYHLTQTVPTKDVTLHVSATNLAMLLYQKFGFKPEKFAVDFYKSYLPVTSRVCPNAFFMRLRRY